MIARAMQRLLYSLRHSLASPSRNPRSAVVVGRLLGFAFILCFGTGLYSHFLQDPLPWMHFATRPTFLYQLTQGIHITAGILCFPLIFAKLYAIYPQLFQYPPVKGPLSILERASIALFVGSSLVQIVIGLLNTYQFYSLFPFPFRQTHYALSFVVIGSLAIHIAVKLPIIQRYWRKRDAFDAAGNLVPPVEEEQELPANTEPHNPPVPASVPLVPDATGLTGILFAWVDRTPEPRPAVSRRGFFATLSIAGATVVALTAGQSFRFLNPTNVFGARKNDTGPQGLPVNRTAKDAKVLELAAASEWVLTVSAGDTVKAFSRADLLAMPQHRVDLPIACVEGWSQMATWSGPRIRDLADSVAAHPEATFKITSLETNSSYGVTHMQPEFVRDDLTLVALTLDGKTLDIDHGYPARVIAPSRPGVLQTKWLSKLEAL